LLQSRVEPHTKLDERLLYPDVADRLGDPLVAASMNYGHLAILTGSRRSRRRTRETPSDSSAFFTGSTC